jgi:ATP-dependent RNA helicase RhlE
MSPSTDSGSDIKTFDQLPLKPDLLRVLFAEGFVQPTPVQRQTIPIALAGHDLIAVAQTGTGKTLGFLVPILHRLVPSGEVQALVICPTRELAQQVGKVAERAGGALGLRTAVLYGGTSLGDQRQQLTKPPDLIVGTPGRLLEFLTTAWLRPRYVRWLVLDEADRMLDMGFIDEVMSIVQRMPLSRQTMLFSATMPTEIVKFSSRLTHEAVTVRIDAEKVAAAGIEHRLYEVRSSDKIAALCRVLDDNRGVKSLVFTATREATSAIASQLRRAGHNVGSLSSLLSQNNRERVLAAFRENETHVLVATDVAGRGIDIFDIDLVINFDLPRNPEDYVHRVGRTGRATRTGLAVSLASSADRGSIREIERLLGHPLPRAPLEGFAAPGEVAAKQRGPRRGRGRAASARRGRGR